MSTAERYPESRARIVEPNDGTARLTGMTTSPNWKMTLGVALMTVGFILSTLILVTDLPLRAGVAMLIWQMVLQSVGVTLWFKGITQAYRR